MRHYELRHHMVDHITKRMCERECLHSERKVLSPDFKESEDAESFERDCSVYLRARQALECESEQSFSFTATSTKENKTVNRLHYNHLCLLIY